MKRFLVFTGQHEHPAGGWKDFSCQFDTADEASKAAMDFLREGYEWSHVVDTEKSKAHVFSRHGSRIELQPLEW